MSLPGLRPPGSQTLGSFAHCCTGLLCALGTSLPVSEPHVPRAPKHSLLTWESSCPRFKSALPSPPGATATGQRLLLKTFSQGLQSTEERQDVTCLHTDCHIPKPVLALLGLGLPCLPHPLLSRLLLGSCSGWTLGDVQVALADSLTLAPWPSSTCSLKQRFAK